MNKLSKQSAHSHQGVDLKKCKIHRIANSYGMPLNYHDKCPCCGKYAQKEPLTLNFSQVKIYYCGPQLAAYLATVKYLTILLSILCLTSALPLMIINHRGKACEKKMECASSLILRYSIFNQFDSHKKLAVESYIIFANFIVCLVVWHVLRNHLRRTKAEIDETNFVPNQYGVLFQLPQQHIQRSAIIQSIEKWWMLQMKYNCSSLQKSLPDLLQMFKCRQDGKEYCQNESKQKEWLKGKVSPLIEDVIFSYNYQQYQQNAKKYKITQMAQPEWNKTGGRQSVKAKDQLLSQPETQCSKRISENKFCLVIFKKKAYARYFCYKNNPSFVQKITCFENFRYLYLNKKRVRVTNEHYPAQIIWKNHHYSSSQKFKLSLATAFVTVFLIVVGTTVIWVLCYLYQAHIQILHNTFSQFYYVLVAFFINIMIVLGNKIITIYTQRQRQDTYESQKSSYVFKIVLFNVSIIMVSPFVIFKLASPHFLWGSNGFLETEVVSLVVYMLAIQIERYLSPTTLKILSDYYHFEAAKTDCQQEANKCHNKPTHCLERQYAAIITIMFINNFMSSYAPLLTIISCIWMLVQFWLQRANIAHFYNQDEFHSSLLSSKMVSFIEFSFSFLIFGSLSSYFLSHQQELGRKKQIKFIILYTIMCSYCLVSIFLPHQKINIKISSLLYRQELEADDTSDYFYQAIKHHFLIHYEDFNEAYQHQKIARKHSSSDMQEGTVDEVHTISASLSLSLKERLLNKNDPIIGHTNEAREENEQYFQYQKKINMRKSKPRVNIPPLFEKDQPFRPSLVTTIVRSQAFD